jgi:Rieske Fe-S protein
MKKFILLFLSVVFIPGIFNSCTKNNIQNPVPDIPFNVSLNITLPEYQPLQIPLGGIVYYNNAGSKGLAILRTSLNDFVVYDRHCPYNVGEGCQVDLDPDNIGVLIDDDCCESAFNMLNAGFPQSGPAEFPLRSYKWSFNGTILRIFN